MEPEEIYGISLALNGTRFNPQDHGQTWNLLRMPNYYPCKISFHFGKLLLRTYCAGCKFHFCCFVVLILFIFGSSAIELILLSLSCPIVPPCNNSHYYREYISLIRSTLGLNQRPLAPSSLPRRALAGSHTWPPCAEQASWWPPGVQTCHSSVQGGPSAIEPFLLSLLSDFASL